MASNSQEPTKTREALQRLAATFTAASQRDLGVNVEFGIAHRELVDACCTYQNTIAHHARLFHDLMTPMLQPSTPARWVPPECTCPLTIVALKTLGIVFMGQCMFESGTYQNVRASLLKQQTIGEDTELCLAILGTINSLPTRIQMGTIGEVPPDCHPERLTYPAMLDQMYDPRVLEVSFKAALACSLPAGRKVDAIQMVNCTMLLLNASSMNEENERASQPRLRILLGQLLEDESFMKTLYVALNSESYTVMTLAAHLLYMIVMGGNRKVTNGAERTGQQQRASGGKTVWRYLRDGKWEVPITNAMGLARVAAEGGLQTAALWESPACVLKTLLSVVREVVHQDSMGFGGPLRTAKVAPAWPQELLTEHLKSGIQALPLKRQDYPYPGACSVSFIDLCIYPIKSLPHAARVLCDHPRVLSALVCELKRRAEALAIIKSEDFIEDCLLGFTFIRTLLLVSEEFALRLPLDAFMDAMLSAFKNLCAHTPGMPDLFSRDAMKRSSLYEPAPAELRRVPGIDCFVELFQITMELPGFERACAPQPEARRGEMLSMIMRLQSLANQSWSGMSGDECNESGDEGDGGIGGEGGASNASGVAAKLAGGLQMGSSGAGESVAGRGESSGRSEREGGAAKRTCMACGKGCTQVCGNCKSAWFCNVACQRLAWKVHKAECKR